MNYIYVAGIDYFLSFYLVSLLFTGFAIAGISNSINIIDGFNGLASGSVLIMMLGISYLTFKVSDFELFKISLFFSSIIIGFMILNFPLGKLFLGDSGAYFLGFILACILVMMPYRNPEISPWTSLMICFYPFFETIFSIYRKTRRSGHKFDKPDGIHLHMLVYRHYSRKLSRALNIGNYQNSITSVIMWPLTILPVLIAINFYYQTLIILFAMVIFILSYLFLYKKLSLN